MAIGRVVLGLLAAGTGTANAVQFSTSSAAVAQAKTANVPALRDGLWRSIAERARWAGDTSGAAIAACQTSGVQVAGWAG